MNTFVSSRRFLAAICLLLLALAPMAAWSQRTTRIVSFTADPGYMSAQGPTLTLQVTGTPNGTAVVRIDGTNEELTMNESGPGIYQVEYTLAYGRRGVAGATAILRAGGQEARRSLGISLEAAARALGRDGRRY